ncbi:MAG: hypothetical protein GVY35_05895 [Bacteroidetes bacterium]|nr:hypothetical protein [Bacteroidota bacterium]
MATLVLVIGFASPAAAQENDPAASEESAAPFWFVVGGGWGTPTHVGSGGAASLNIGHRPAFQLGVSVNQRFRIFQPAPVTFALNSGVGMRVHADRFSQIAFFAGPSLVGAGHYRMGSSQQYDFTGGAVGSVQAFVKPFDALGLGLEAYGNINPVRSYAGLRISILIVRY